MILRRIELRSFRQFVEADVDFDLGITVILGDNGSGKTTLLEAVKYSLYGDCRGKIESLPNMHHGGKMSVAVEFDLGDTRYRCERNKSDAMLRKRDGDGWETIAFTLNGVKDYSAKLLGLTCEQFCSSYFTEQKEIEFLKFAKARQQEQISQMLGIEVLAAACRVAKEEAKASDIALTQTRSMLENKEQMEADLSAKRGSLAQRKSELDAATAELASAEDKLTRLRPEHSKAVEFQEITTRMRTREDVGRQLKADLEAFKMDLDKAAAEVGEKQSLKVAADEFVSLCDRHAELTKELGKFGDREKLVFALDERRKESAILNLSFDPKANEQLAEAERKHAVAVKQREEAAAAHAKAKTEWYEEQRSSKSECESHQKELQRLTAELREVEDAEAKGVCPTCGQKLPDGHAPRSDVLRKEIASVSALFEMAAARGKKSEVEPIAVESASRAEGECERMLGEAAKSVFDAQVETRKKAECESRIVEVQSEILKIEKEIAASPTTFDRAAYDAITERVAQLKSGHMRWMALANAEAHESAASKRFEEKQRQFEAEKASQAADRSRMQEIGMSEERAFEIQRDFAQTENAVPHLAQKVNGCKQAHKSAEEAVTECHARIEKWKENAAKVEQHRHNRDLYREVSDAMQELRTKLNSEIRPTLAAVAGETLMQVTDNRYNRVFIDESFKAFLYDGEHKKGVISGGEEDVLALALRIALSRYVQEKSGLPLSMLVLDEVFGSLDSDRKQNVLEMFDGLKGMFPQILLISHVENLTEHADRVLRVRFDAKAKAAVVEDFVSEPALL